MKTVLQIGVPTILIALMFVVGLDIRAVRAKSVGRWLRLIVVAMVGQVVLLPIVAVLLVRTIGLDAGVATGILLIAVCPAGAISNTYTYLAEANTTLSVALTTLSCLLAVISMPIAFGIGARFIGSSVAFDVPVESVFVQLALFVLLPTALGVFARIRYPSFIERRKKDCQRLSFLFLAVLVLLIVVPEFDRFVTELPRAAPCVVALTIASMASGWCIGWVLGGDRRDNFAIMVEFAVRNVAIATLIAVTVLDQVEFAVLGAIYFLTQMPILIVAGVWMRRRS